MQYSLNPTGSHKINQCKYVLRSLRGTMYDCIVRSDNLRPVKRRGFSVSGTEKKKPRILTTEILILRSGGII